MWKFVFSLSILFVFTLSSCSSLKDTLGADPAPDSGFIKGSQDMGAWKERAPVHKIWFKDREKFYSERDKYKKIHFRPVRTDFIAAKGWWSEMNTSDQDQYTKDVEEMATFIREQFTTAFKEDKNKRFEVVDEIDEETIVYEIALTELIATKAHVNAAGTALGMVVPGGGLISSATAKGSIAIEAKVFAGNSDEMLVAWADRETDRSALFSFSDFSWYSHARATVQNWTVQLVEGWNTPITKKVEDRTLFTLNPF